jgi:holo-[acyl-carrier protein] synthase
MAKISKKTQQTLRAAQTIAVAQGPAAGLGVQLVDIERMRTALDRTPRITNRIFTAAERAAAKRKTKPAVYFAQLFAAKTAVLKALGGEQPLPLTMLADIEISTDKNGRPTPVLLHRAAQVAAGRGVVDVQLSSSYTHSVAVASAVAITAGNRPHKEVPPDPHAELARQFKDLRSLV